MAPATELRRAAIASTSADHYGVLVRRLSLGVMLLLTSAVARAGEPWSDPDPAEPPARYPIGAVGVAAEAEYRAQLTMVNPILLASESNRRFNLIEHRGRFGTTIDYRELVKMSVSVDVLDGVLWGDNGTFGETPSSDSGLQATARDPNVVKPCIGYDGAGDPLEAESYGYQLCDADVLAVRRLWAQVSTPIGVVRVGRQPVNVGMAVQTADGNGRHNRFGVAYQGDQVDRVLFATKPIEAFKPAAARNRSETEGLIVVAVYDRWVSDSPQIFDDDVHQVAGALRFLEPELGSFENVEITGYYAHRWNVSYDTRINTVGGRAIARLGPVHAGFDMAANIGSTKEVSDAYALISNDPVVDQQVLQYGARAVVRVDQPLWTAYFELDYASGDGDPQTRTPLTQFRFSEDTNVGLLLFDHIVRYQSARASAAAVEIIRRLGAETFPAERVHTRGAFTDAFALFPQLDLRPHESLLFRFGALFAWAPEVVVDPVASLQARDGVTIDDDLVNFVGGPPGSFYGVELDGRFGWRLLEHFALDLEGAVLFPGDALRDANGDAVNSFLMQARTTFFF